MSKKWKKQGEVDFYTAVDKLLPHQKALIQSPALAAAMVGGQGSGKSLTLNICAILNAARDPNGFSLIGRLNYPALESSTMMQFIELIPEHFGEWMETPKEFHFTNGHVIKFSHLDITDPKVAGHIKSMNLSGAYIDEATEISEQTYLLLTGRVRRKTAPMHLIRLASNPAGRDWVWRYFFDPHRAKPFQANYGINMSTFDNPYLPEEVVANWKATYPLDWADRYLNGNFSDMSDLVYKEFTERTHVWDSRKEWEIFGGRTDPPEDWPIVIGMDIGSDTEHDPWAISLIAVQPETGWLFQFDEVYGNGLLIAEIADQLFAKLAGRPRPDVAYDYAQRQCALELAECGIDGAPALKEVQPGIFKVAQYMHIDSRLIHPFSREVVGSPRFFMASRCVHHIEDFTSYKWAIDRAGMPTGKPAHDHSHGPDDVRYAIHTFRPLPEKPRVVEIWEAPGISELSRQFWRGEVEREKRESIEKAPNLLRFGRPVGLFQRPAYLKSRLSKLGLKGGVP